MTSNIILLSTMPISLYSGFCYWSRAFLTHQYIYNSLEKLPWDQVGEIKADQEKLTIKEKDASGDWLSLPISLFPNVCVMEELLRHIKQEQGLDTQLLL
ncbi:MAG: hypothetical protein H0V70_15000 [Ktedonobacteraceae bacterium]|nr:hypothetical protein [Ktedonobacteraceae bacterium]